jgi:hypothetical protein
MNTISKLLISRSQNEDYWIGSWQAMKNLENSPQPECYVIEKWDVSQKEIPNIKNEIDPKTRSSIEIWNRLTKERLGQELKHEISHIDCETGNWIYRATISKTEFHEWFAHWRTTLKFWTTDGAFMMVIIITIIIKPAASPWNCCKSSLQGVQSSSKGVKSATHLYCKQYQNYYLFPFLLVCHRPNLFFLKKDRCCPDTLWIMLRTSGAKTCITGPKSMPGQQQEASGQHQTHLVLRKWSVRENRSRKYFWTALE